MLGTHSPLIVTAQNQSNIWLYDDVRIKLELFVRIATTGTGTLSSKRISVRNYAKAILPKDLTTDVALQEESGIESLSAYKQNSEPDTASSNIVFPE